MVITQKYVFVDDTGNSGLSFNNEGTSSHYILTAVIVDDTKLDQVKSEVELIRKKHFQTGEMKSSKVAKDDRRRIHILKDLQSIDFHSLSFVIQKDRLARSGGFSHHGSFVKFLSKQIHRDIHIFYPGAIVVADEHGDKLFMNEFCDYIKRQPQISLFDIYQFSFDVSSANIMLQLADFIAGTIARGYEKRNKSKNYQNFIRLIEDKILDIKQWPGDYQQHLDNIHREVDLQHDADISQCAIRLANGYIQDNANNQNLDIRARVVFLEYLLFRLRYHRPDIYVYAREIQNHLNKTLGHKYNSEQLRNNVVGPLRDRGIIVASGRNGYKIPISKSELYNFFDNSMSIINPMIKRLIKCRNQIRIATTDEYDILSDDRYSALRRLLQENTEPGSGI